MSGANDFDFLLGSWNIRNRRRTNPYSPNQDGVWEEFVASHTGTKYLEGKVIIEQYEGTFPSGEKRLGSPFAPLISRSNNGRFGGSTIAIPWISALLLEHFRTGLAYFMRIVKPQMVNCCMCGLLGMRLRRIRREGLRLFLLMGGSIGRRIG